MVKPNDMLSEILRTKLLSCGKMIYLYPEEPFRAYSNCQEAYRNGQYL